MLMLKYSNILNDNTTTSLQQTICHRFKKQLNNLMSHLKSTRSQFVRW